MSYYQFSRTEILQKAKSKKKKQRKKKSNEKAAECYLLNKEHVM